MEVETVIDTIGDGAEVELALMLKKTNPFVLKKTDPCDAQQVGTNGCS